MLSSVSRRAIGAPLRVASVAPLTAAQPVRLYHDNVIEHYENPRNVGTSLRRRSLRCVAWSVVRHTDTWQRGESPPLEAPHAQSVCECGCVCLYGIVCVRLLCCRPTAACCCSGVCTAHRVERRGVAWRGVLVLLLWWMSRVFVSDGAFSGGGLSAGRLAGGHCAAAVPVPTVDRDGRASLPLFRHRPTFFSPDTPVEHAACVAHIVVHACVRVAVVVRCLVWRSSQAPCPRTATTSAPALLALPPAETS